MRHALFAFLISTSFAFGASQQFIFPGYRANDNLGDDLRTTQIVINTNFTELFNRTGYLGTNGFPSAANAASWRSALNIDYPTINVKQYPYSAAGDGETDDAAAIGAAITGLGTNGGVILFPPGEYIIGSTITIDGSVNKEVTLQGFASFNTVQTTSKATTIKLADSADCDMLIKEIGGRLNISGIIFDGNRSNQTSTNLHGIWLVGTNTQTERVVLDNIVIESVSGVGLQNDNRETHAYRVNVRDCLGDGIRNTASGDTSWWNILSGFNYGNGFANVGAAGIGAGNVYFFGGNLFRNGLNGLWLTNSANSSYYHLVIDANNQNGILIEGPSWRNRFFGCTPIVNNYPTWVDNVSDTPHASGTYSNVKVSGTNAVGLAFVACNFFQYESTLTHRPKYLFEDVRTGSVTNYAGIAFDGCNFAEGDFSVLGPYDQLKMLENAGGEWMLDGVPAYRRNRNYQDLQTDDLRARDQFEAAVGMQVNAYFSGGGWLYRSNGPAFYLSGRYDDPVLRLYYAGTNTADSALTWTNALAVNSTNGYVAIGREPTVLPFDVNGKARFEAAETLDGYTANAYYDGAWKRRAAGFAYYLQSQLGYSNLVLNVAVSNATDSAITFVPALALREDGKAAFYDNVSAASFSVGATAGIDAIYTNLISGVITQRVTVAKGIITGLETLP